MKNTLSIANTHTDVLGRTTTERISDVFDNGNGTAKVLVHASWVDSGEFMVGIDDFFADIPVLKVN